ncbi:Glucosamine-phosphate N-acetyltransferase-like protein [Nowakowskiella sp. JEL0407]|nr:Glucosamine-phosphate N-acetyltransferase-like protein [Nowakowskiella sp. JEL0407]
MALFDKLYISGDVQNALPAGFVVRPLEIGDYEKGFLEALEMLTSVGKMSKGQFIDTKKAKIVGAGTIFVERKFVHLNGLVGHIEDIVTHKDYRGMNLGKL